MSEATATEVRQQQKRELDLAENAPLHLNQCGIPERRLVCSASMFAVLTLAFDHRVIDS